MKALSPSMCTLVSGGKMTYDTKGNDFVVTGTLADFQNLQNDSADFEEKMSTGIAYWLASQIPVQLAKGHLITPSSVVTLTASL